MLEMPPAITEEDPERPSLAAADDQIFVSIAVEIAPGHARAELAQAAWQERLEREVIEVILDVPMLD